MTDRLIQLYGTAEPLPDEVALAAGPIEALFLGGALRSIRYRGVEVIRGISFLIRDRNWATVVPEIRDLAIDAAADRFEIRFSAHGVTPADGQALVWRGQVTGSAEAGIRFSAQAVPGSDFVTGRTGFIVLHPLERVVGCPVTIEHTDGTREDTAFPDLIDPLQSFFDIRAMTHAPLPGIRATCRMQGGAWETEDHRNWLDASFKTYFRPLSLPWPYTVPAGEEIRQEIALTFEVAQPDAPAAGPRASAPMVAIGDRTGLRMPEIGLSVSSAAELDAALRLAGAVDGLGVRNLAIRVHSAQPDLPGYLRRAAVLADAISAGATLEVIAADRQGPSAALDLVAIAAASAGLVPRAVVVSPELDLKSYPPSVDRPPAPPLADYAGAARAAFPGVPVGGGMYSYFTELNRRRAPAGLFDFVQHATAAIVHAADDRSVMETLESLPHVFRSARAFLGRSGYRVGPATIGMPFNPYGASSTPNPDNLKRTMVAADPRQAGLFGAAWVAGYLARAAQGGVDAVTLMAPGGPGGLIGPEGPRPASHVVRDFASVAGAPVLQAASSHPQEILACATEQAGRRILWIANLTPERRRVPIAGFEPVSAALLDEESPNSFGARQLAGLAVDLDAYAVARLEG